VLLGAGVSVGVVLVGLHAAAGAAEAGLDDGPCETVSTESER
jgi:hypothetical protein